MRLSIILRGERVPSALIRSSGITDLSKTTAPDSTPRYIPGSLRPPVVVSSTQANSIQLVEEEWKRLEARKKKLFDDMIVFDGGSVDDNETLGKHMIFRNFVHFALYHKKWGFYSRLFRRYRDQATSGFFDPVPFGSLRSLQDYAQYVGKINEATPTFISPPQLFQPYYGWVFAEYLIGVHRAKFHPSEPLVIYEVGAGTGAFAEQVLNFLAEFHPQVYENVEYHLVEMNANHVQLQRNRLIHHFHRVKIHNISFLNWRELEPRRCFVIGIQLLSCMPHDVVVWSKDGTCYERWISFLHRDDLSSGQERLLQCKDPAVLRYLRCLNWLREETFHTLKVLCVTDGRENIDPVRFEMLEPDTYETPRTTFHKAIASMNPYRTAYIPTATTMMLEMMAEYFPRHHALFADWSEVDQPLMGHEAPVVQAKLRISKNLYMRRVSSGLMENCGLVDICFPTNFDNMKKVYSAICGEKEIVSMSHPDFWKTFGGDKTAIYTTKSGYNPLVQDFGSFHIFSTHHPTDR